MVSKHTSIAENANLSATNLLIHCKCCHFVIGASGYCRACKIQFVEATKDNPFAFVETVGETWAQVVGVVIVVVAAAAANCEDVP